jgi:hypothetical protein
MENPRIIVRSRVDQDLYNDMAAVGCGRAGNSLVPNPNPVTVQAHEAYIV